MLLLNCDDSKCEKQRGRHYLSPGPNNCSIAFYVLFFMSHFPGYLHLLNDFSGVIYGDVASLWSEIPSLSRDISAMTK
jgi:hypothetical protein